MELLPVWRHNKPKTKKKNERGNMNDAESETKTQKPKKFINKIIMK